MNGRVFYWVGGASGNEEAWDNGLNWADVSNGAGGSAHGSSYPDQAGDIAIIDDNSDYNITSLGTSITIAALINLSGTYYFFATDNTLTVGGMIIAETIGRNSGNVTGSAIFSGGGSVNFGTVTGPAIFSASNSQNMGTVTGPAIFSGAYTSNDGDIEDGIFSGSYATNRYNVNGNAIFSGPDSHNSGNGSSFIDYSAIFSGSNSRNDGIVGYYSNNTAMVLSGSSAQSTNDCYGHVVVTGSSAQSGPVNGACILDGGSARITGTVAKGAIILTGFNDVRTINGGCIISSRYGNPNEAWNEGTINDGCILGDYGKNTSASGVINDGCLIVGPAASNVNSGTIAGPCIVLVGSTFTNEGTISGTLLPLTTFTNSGTLSGKKPLDVLSTGLS